MAADLYLPIETGRHSRDCCVRLLKGVMHIFVAAESHTKNVMPRTVTRNGGSGGAEAHPQENSGKSLISSFGGKNTGSFRNKAGLSIKLSRACRLFQVTTKRSQTGLRAPSAGRFETERNTREKIGRGIKATAQS